jgi:hypothetical protein
MNEGANTLVDTYMKAQLIDYVITFLGFLDPLYMHVFSTNIKQKLAFSPLQVHHT